MLKNHLKKSAALVSILSLVVSSLIFSASAQANPNKPENNGKQNASTSNNSKGNNNSNPRGNSTNSNSPSVNQSGPSATNNSNNNTNGNSANPSVNNNSNANRIISGSNQINQNKVTPKGAAVTGTKVRTKNIVDEKKFKSASLLKGQAGKKRVNKRADRVKFAKSDPNCGEPIVRGNGRNQIQTNEKVQCFDYLVVFTAGTSAAQADKAVGSINGQVKRKYSRVINAALVHANPNRIAALSKNPNVRLIEQDARVNIAGVQVNPTWGLDRIDQRALPLNGSYDDLNNTGSNVPVYVVDTGIYAAHSDFENRVTAGFTAITDGRGSNDCNGHGTHVAGTIGGKNYGVAKTVTLVPVRVLDCAGSGTYSGVIAGLDWIAANHPAGVPTVINMSLGGPASSSLDIAVNNLVNRKMSVVVAAGNSNADACNFSPARVPNAITVGATASNDSRANYSNYGSCLDLFAPGSSITSTWVGSTSATNTISGTSMASPHVAGIAARLLASNPGLSPSQVESSIKSGATTSVVSNAGPGSLNLLAYSLINSDGSVTNPDDGGTTEPAPTKPTKGNKGGKGKGKKAGLTR
jgi:subtilisin family serine protease